MQFSLFRLFPEVVATDECQTQHKSYKPVRLQNILHKIKLCKTFTRNWVNLKRYTLIRFFFNLYLKNSYVYTQFKSFNYWSSLW